MLLVHAGNRIDLANRPTARFSATQVPAVRASVGRLLDALQPSDVVSAAAAGADLIVLEEAINRGIAIHVVLPIARHEFVDQSVIDSGPEWVQRFDSVLEHASTDDGCSFVVGDEAADDDWFLPAQEQLLRHAERIAAGRIIVALTIRPPDGEMPPSVTDHFASRAEAMGLLSLCIDPRPRSPATLIVI